MISLKKYLDSETTNPANEVEPDGDGVASAAIAAYSSALVEMGRCSLEVCPGLGGELKLHLGELSSSLSCAVSRTVLQSTHKAVQEQLRNWGGRTARHYQQKSDEVKELLIVMAKMAESFGTRDQRCAGQINAVTARLTAIASLDDLAEIRASIETSAAELKTSIERMTEEGEIVIYLRREQVSNLRRLSQHHRANSSQWRNNAHLQGCTEQCTFRGRYLWRLGFLHSSRPAFHRRLQHHHCW